MNYEENDSKNFSYSDIDPIFSGGLVGYDTHYDVIAIKQSLINLFTVQKGEVPGKPHFGNPLNIALFDVFDPFTSMTIESAVETAITRYEPRVTLEKIEIIESPEFNRILVEIQFIVIIANRPVQETLYIPFAHNTMTYINSRTTQTIQQRT